MAVLEAILKTYGPLDYHFQKEKLTGAIDTFKRQMSAAKSFPVVPLVRFLTFSFSSDLGKGKDF